MGTGFNRIRVVPWRGQIKETCLRQANWGTFFNKFYLPPIDKINMATLNAICGKIAACLCQELMEEWRMDIDHRRELIQIRRKTAEESVGVIHDGVGDVEGLVKIEAEEDVGAGTGRAGYDGVMEAEWSAPTPAKRRGGIASSVKTARNRRSAVPRPFSSALSQLPSEGIKIEDDSLWSDIKLTAFAPLVSLPMLTMDEEIKIEDDTDVAFDGGVGGGRGGAKRGRGRPSKRGGRSATNLNGALLNDIPDVIGADNVDDDYGGDTEMPDEHDDNEGGVDYLISNVEEAPHTEAQIKKMSKKQLEKLKRLQQNERRRIQRKARREAARAKAKAIFEGEGVNVEGDVKPVVDLDEKGGDEAEVEEDEEEGGRSRRRRERKSYVSYVDSENEEDDAYFKEKLVKARHLKPYTPKNPIRKRKKKDEEEDFVPAGIKVRVFARRRYLVFYHYW